MKYIIIFIILVFALPVMAQKGEIIKDTIYFSTVYNESDASALYAPIVDVAGGASTLHYTATTTAAPSSQPTMLLDGSTFPNQGSSYTFTCKLLSGGYRWVLEQR